MPTLTIRDETAKGEMQREIEVEFPEDRISVRELIRGRIYEEVQDFNRRKPETFRGLVQPGETEQALNGYKMKKHRSVDWEKQFEKALEAFKGNGFLLLVDDHQPDNLEDMVEISADTKVSFIKLVPLVGG